MSIENNIERIANALELIAEKLGNSSVKPYQSKAEYAVPEAPAAKGRGRPKKKQVEPANPPLADAVTQRIEAVVEAAVEEAGKDEPVTEPVATPVAKPARIKEPLTPENQAKGKPEYEKLKERLATLPQSAKELLSPKFKAVFDEYGYPGFPFFTQVDFIDALPKINALIDEVSKSPNEDNIPVEL